MPFLTFCLATIEKSPENPQIEAVYAMNLGFYALALLMRCFQKHETLLNVRFNVHVCPGTIIRVNYRSTQSNREFT